MKKRSLLFRTVFAVAALFGLQEASAVDPGTLPGNYCTITKRVNESCINYTLDNVKSHALKGAGIKVGGTEVLTLPDATTTFNWLQESKRFSAQQGQEIEFSTTTGPWSNNVWVGFDWNRDGEFDYVYPVYGVGRVGGGANDTKTFKISVPSDAQVGLSRIRIISDGLNCALLWNVLAPMCGTHGAAAIGYAGSVSDISINVTAAPLAKYTMTTSAPLGGGSITINGEASPVQVNAGTKVTFQAVPANGYEFVSFLDGLIPVTTNPYVIESVGRDVTLTGTFAALPKIILDITVNNPLLGTVSILNSGGGTDIFKGEDITLTATPLEGARFVNWTNLLGVEVSRSSVYVVSNILLDLTLTANFEPIPATKYDVSATPFPSASAGSVTINGAASPVKITSGEKATFEATPAPGYKFVYWAENYITNVSNNNPYETTVTGDISLTAMFTELTKLNVSAVSSNISLGTVSFTHSGTLPDILEGEDVTFTATPIAGGIFVNWTDADGNVVSFSQTYNVTNLLTDLALTANFIPKKTAPSSSITFNGTNQYVRIPNSADFRMNNTEDLSISMWVKSAGIVLPNARRVLGYRVGSDVESAYELYALTSGYACTATGIAGSNTNRFIDAVLGGVGGTWTHLAVVFDRTGGNSHAYVNGVEVPLASKPITPAMSIASTRDLLIAAGWNSSGVVNNNFAGDIANVRIYKRSLSPGEVAIDASSDYSELPSSIKNSCVAAYKLDNANLALTLPDLTGKGNNGTLNGFVIQGVSDSELASARVWFAGEALNIEGVNAGDDVKVYGANGVIVHEGVSGGGTMSVNVSAAGLYMVKINGQVFKAIK